MVTIFIFVGATLQISDRPVKSYFAIPLSLRLLFFSVLADGRLSCLGNYIPTSLQQPPWGKMKVAVIKRSSFMAFLNIAWRRFSKNHSSVVDY